MRGPQELAGGDVPAALAAASGGRERASTDANKAASSKPPDPDLISFIVGLANSLFVFKLPAT